MRMIIAAAVLACAGIGGAQAGVLERAKETGELRIGYRTDAQPFSFKDSEGKAAGYSVDLCRAVVEEAAVELGGGRAQGGRDRGHRGRTGSTR